MAEEEAAVKQPVIMLEEDEAISSCPFLPAAAAASSMSSSGCSSSASASTSGIFSKDEEEDEEEGELLSLAKEKEALLEMEDSPKEVVTGKFESWRPHPSLFRVRARLVGRVEVAEREASAAASSKDPRSLLRDCAEKLRVVEEEEVTLELGGDLTVGLSRGCDDGDAICSHPISQIRLWGGVEGGGGGGTERFAFVAAAGGEGGGEEAKRTNTCYVLRCCGDLSAPDLCRVFRNLCRMAGERTATGSVISEASSTTSSAASSTARKEQDLADGGPAKKSKQRCVVVARTDPSFFPPLDEGRRSVFRPVFYLGSVRGDVPGGIGVVHDAVDRLGRVDGHKCSLAVTTGSVTMSDLESSAVAREWRTSRVTFLGMGRDDVSAAAIVVADGSASEKDHGRRFFSAHVFRVRPSAGPLCRALQSACEDRFRRKLRAEESKRPPPSPASTKRTRGARQLGERLKSLMSSPLTKKKL